MRLATLENNSLAAVTKNGIVKLSKAGFSGSMLDLIKAGENKWEEINTALQTAEGNLDPKDLKFAAPLSNPPKIVAIGLNYTDHANESKLKLPN